jgi:pyruvate/2-oxoglutarate dehydrogenase complex dihydrolipoamide acyltransferase (E2) component
MPQMGVSIAEATVVEWKKQPGDQVEADEPLLEISTDKAESELPAPVSGRLAEVTVEAGETVEVGTVLATIETSPSAGASSVAEQESRAATAAERPARGAERPPGTGGNGGAPRVTPVVRRMAEEHELDLSEIEGSGRRGRVTKKDVVAYMRRRGGDRGAAGATAGAAHGVALPGGGAVRPCVRARRVRPARGP